MNRAFILSIEAPLSDKPEELVVKMAKMLVTTLRLYGGCHKNADIYIGIFSRLIPNQQDLMFFKKHNVQIDIVPDYYFLIDKTKYPGLVLGRHLSCHYYGNKILNQYDELIYLDTDILILNEPKFPDCLSHQIMADLMTPEYVAWEKEYAKYKEVNQLLAQDLNQHITYKRFFTQWIANVNKLNLWLYNELFEILVTAKSLHDNKYNRWGTAILNWLFEKHSLVPLPVHNYSAIMPYRDKWTSESSIIHYDALNDNGYLYQLFNLENSKDKQRLIKYMIQTFNITLEPKFKFQIEKIKNKKDREWFNERVKK